MVLTRQHDPLSPTVRGTAPRQQAPKPGKKNSRRKAAKPPALEPDAPVLQDEITAALEAQLAELEAGTDKE